MDNTAALTIFSDSISDFAVGIIMNFLLSAIRKCNYALGILLACVEIADCSSFSAWLTVLIILNDTAALTIFSDSISNLTVGIIMNFLLSAVAKRNNFHRARIACFKARNSCYLTNSLAALIILNDTIAIAVLGNCIKNIAVRAVVDFTLFAVNLLNLNVLCCCSLAVYDITCRVIGLDCLIAISICCQN